MSLQDAGLCLQKYRDKIQRSKMQQQEKFTREMENFIEICECFAEIDMLPANVQLEMETNLRKLCTASKKTHQSTEKFLEALHLLDNTADMKLIDRVLELNKCESSIPTDSESIDYCKKLSWKIWVPSQKCYTNCSFH